MLEARDQVILSQILRDAPKFDFPIFDANDIWKYPEPPSVGRVDAIMGQLSQSRCSDDDAVQTQDIKRRRLLAARLTQSDDQLVTAAMRKLRELILYKPEDTRLGAALLTVSGKLVPEDDVAKSFKDSVAGKAPGTISARVASYHKFARWVIEKGLGRPMVPTENNVYKYITSLQQGGSAATSGHVFLKTLGFFQHHFGFVSADLKIVISGRVRGVAKSMLARKQPLHQAPPLKVDHVWRLELYLHSSRCTAKMGCVVGFLLFARYASAGFADAARIGEYTIETHKRIMLVEAVATEYKTASMVRQERRCALSPYMAIGCGLHRMSWAQQWTLFRKAELHRLFPPLPRRECQVTHDWVGDSHPISKQQRRVRQVEEGPVVPGFEALL